MDRQPKIDEMIKYLEKSDPASLNAIRQANPGFSDILKEGEVLGLADNPEELNVRATVCMASLETAIKSCNELLPKLRKRLKDSQKWQLGGQILTTISGASVITTLAIKLTAITYIAGALSLLGSLVPLVIDQRNRGLDKSKHVDEIYTELVKLRLDAESNARELGFFINDHFNSDGIRDVINRSNQLCSDIMEKEWIS